MSDIVSKPFSPYDEEQWNEFLLKHATVPPLIHSLYCKSLEETFAIDTPKFVARDQNQNITGILSTHVLQSGTRPRELYSPPFGLVVDNDESGILLLEAVHKYCLMHNTKRTTISSGQRYISTSFKSWKKVTIIKELGEDIDAIWNCFRHETRKSIRRAKKMELTAESGFEYLEKFHNVYAKRLTEIGISFFNLQYFKNLVRNLPEHLKLFVAFHQGELVGGLMFFYGKNVALSFATSGASGRFNGVSLGVHDFLMWEVIQDCVKQGIEIVDLGEASPGSGVYTFKTRGMGGDAKAVYYYDVMSGSDEETRIFKQSFMYRLRRHILPYLPNRIKRKALEINKKYERLV